MNDINSGVKAEEMMKVKALASAVELFAQKDGDYATDISGLTFYRRSAATEPSPCIYGLSLAVITGGGKQVTLGDEVFNYGAGQFLLTTVDLPVVAHVTRASSAEPFLCLMLALDARQIVQLAAEMELPEPAKEYTYRAMSVGTSDPVLLDALTRLVRLLDEPKLIPQLAHLIQQEIAIRLLAGPQGSMLRYLVAAGSPNQQIAKTMAWFKQNFSRALRIDELAASAHMSPSTFRQHFRAMAGMSPLQYQKQLRLQAARQLMLNENLDAGSAGVRVGYESASQFSREYSRLFGAPPVRDIQRMRNAP